MNVTILKLENCVYGLFERLDSPFTPIDIRWYTLSDSVIAYVWKKVSLFSGLILTIVFQIPFV